MLKPFTNMMKGMSPPGQPNPAESPFVDSLTQVTHQIGILYSLFYGDYDAGDFCKGLILSKEASTIALTFGRNVIGGFFGDYNSDVHDYVSN